MFIHKDMQIEEIIELYPQTIGPLQKLGVQCLLCGEPVWGTLEQKVRDKGLDNLDEIVVKLNLIIEQTNK